ncbi:glycosyltransferase family 2 protein [Fusobacterium ulcerans]|uniref:glycosyltransferase family 2 protein n=1 Tax=Fusobacterium ulcerans TaxID=861 RepID=UPI001D09B525|nr:glycosyltransferase family 2 protein [Fusobacterium ulcerans]MCB8566203.1 glycosyltransferase family 2 protein [Fusobacterium ulcerans]MCB8650286.1 glycosyltransferase family 2 protein [Fusobacterium ulcerans]
MKKISVIVPVYNVEKYIEKCIRSIMEQTLEEIEIIIINDGSPDRSLEIINRLMKEDQRIKVITKKNGGLSSARNTGIKIATGKYIQHIDGDDWVEKDFLKNMYEFAEKENLDIVVSDYYEDYFDGKKKIKKGKKKSEKTIFGSKEYLKDFFYNGDAPAMWNKLFKTSLYKENNIFHPENISIGEDLSTTPKLIYFSKKIGYLKKAFYHYIQNPKSITNTTTGINKCQIFQCFDLLDEFFKEKNEKFEDLLYRYSIYHISNFLFFKPMFNNKEYIKGYKSFLLLISDKRFDENTNRINKIKVFFIKILKYFPYKITFLFLNKIVVLLKKIKSLIICF